MPKSRLTHTIVVLDMTPYRAGRSNTERPIVRIWHSGIGHELEQAVTEINDLIEASENGQRDLVELHRLRAHLSFSKVTSFKPIEAVLKSVHARAKNCFTIPIDGFFKISVQDAKEAILAGLDSFPKDRAAAKKKAAKVKATRERTRAKKDVLIEEIYEHCFYRSPHAEDLCNALDGQEGRALQSWATKELARQSELSAMLRQHAVKEFRKLGIDVFEYRKQVQNNNEDEDYGLADNELGVVKTWYDSLPENVVKFVDIVTGVVDEQVWDERWDSPLMQDIAKVVLIDSWNSDSS